MAKVRKKKRKKETIKKVKYRVSIYQIQIKGPEKNKTFQKLLSKIQDKLLSGKPLAEADRFGTVIRSINGVEESKLNALQLTLVKYNQKRTGLSWDTKKSILVSDSGRVTAQRTELIIFIEHHVAILIHKTHGPNPSQIKFYLENIFRKEARNSNTDCEIDILPLKVGGTTNRIRQWQSINKFSIEFIKPNPSGTLRARRLRELLNSSNADKGQLSLTGKTESGLKFSGIEELIEEGDNLIETGQGRMRAEGVDDRGNKEQIDSKNIAVNKISVETLSNDLRSLAELFKDKLKRFIE